MKEENKKASDHMKELFVEKTIYDRVEELDSGEMQQVIEKIKTYYEQK